jgi:hypothetical protein
VFIICQEALADCPSCAPALDALAQYLFSMACLLRDAAGAPAAGGGSSGSSSGVLARARDAAEKAIAVLEQAAVADPMRRAHLAMRRGQAAALLQQLAPA